MPGFSDRRVLDSSEQAARGTQAIRRAIRILKAFDSVQPNWDPSALSTALGLARGTVVRMLSALEEEGFVVRSDSGRYSLGPELIVLGHLAVRETDLRIVAEPHMNELSEQSCEAVTLEVPSVSLERSPASMLVIQEVAGKHLLGVRPFAGRRLPLHATSTGQALLAALPEDGLEKHLPRTLESYTERTVVDHTKLRERLRQVREQGYAYVAGELERGLVAMAAAVFDAKGAPVAALSIHWPKVRFDEAKTELYGSWLKGSASAISKRLGYANHQREMVAG